VLVIVAGVYASLCVIGRLAYPRMLFPAPRLDVAPPLADPAARVVDLPRADGTRTIGIHFPPSPHARTVVVFHGNGETVFDDVFTARALVDRGLGVLLVEYRGYGTLHGPAPSEASLYEDGEAAFAWLARENVAPERIAVWGWSLGASIAAEMAHRGHGARLVLISPWTSIPDMAKRVAPILPVRLLLSHRLDTLSKAPEIRPPTVVVHGVADEIIPFAMGEAVAGALPAARLVRVEGGHHADLLLPGRSRSPDATSLLADLVSHLAGP
jgi:fermentation-respiration switch protein FrsA (DUF1100 family)